MTESSVDILGLGEADLPGIARQWGTPLYVVSADQLAANVSSVSAALQGIHLLYSLKTNYLPAVARRMEALGVGVDVVSGFEMQAALDAGFPGDRIVFNGPVKRLDELARAVDNDIFTNIDGPQEIDTLAELAGLRDRLSQPISVGLRVYPPGDVYADDPGAQRPMPPKFGWPIAGGAADKVADRIIKTPQLWLSGIQVHLGSQITNEDSLLQILRPMLAWIVKLRERTQLTRINIGGGFGVPGIHRARNAPGGDAPPRSFNLAKFGLALHSALSEYQLQDLSIYAEPGRALVSSAAVLMTQVISVKRLHDHAWVILDGGVNLLPTAGIAERHAIVALRRGKRAATYMVGGPLCSEADVLGVNVELPDDLRPGDLVLIHDAGAYGFSLANSFNQLRGATVVVSSGKAELAWRQETYPDLMRLAAAG
jgi:diaminopimelate decarboxylase